MQRIRAPNHISIRTLLFNSRVLFTLYNNSVDRMFVSIFFHLPVLLFPFSISNKYNHVRLKHSELLLHWLEIFVRLADYMT